MMTLVILQGLLVLAILSLNSSLLITPRSKASRSTILRAVEDDDVREARVAPANPQKAQGKDDVEDVKPAIAKKKVNPPVDAAPKAAPQAETKEEKKSVVPLEDVPSLVAKEVKKEMAKKTEEKGKNPATPLDTVASLIKDLEAGQKPGTEATRKILEEEAKLKKLKVDEFNYLGTGTAVGGSTLGLVLGSIVAIQNLEALGAEIQKVAIVVVGFGVVFGGGAYAAYFTKQAQNLELPESIFGSGATVSKLATDLLGRPTIQNFEGLRKQIFDTLNGVKTDIKTSVEDTKTSIVTFPDTVKAGIEMKVEETKAETKAELERTQKRLQAAPGELVETSKNTVNQVAFDLKEAAIRAAEQQVEDLKTLPSRTIERVKASAKSTAENLINDIKSAPGAIADGIKSEVEAIPTKAQKGLESTVEDIKRKVVGGGGDKKKASKKK